MKGFFQTFIGGAAGTSPMYNHACGKEQKMKKLFIFVLCFIFIMSIYGCSNSSQMNNSVAPRNQNNTSSVADVLEAGMAKEDVKKSDVPENDKEPAKDGNIADTDLVSSDNKVNGSNSLSNSCVNIDENPIPSEGTVNSDESSGFNENTDNDVEKLSDSNSEGNADDGIGESNSIDIDLTALSSTMIYSEVSNMMFEPDDYVGKTVKMEGNFSVYHDEASDKYYFACIIQDATACCAQGLEFVLKDSYKFPDDYPEVGEEVCVSGVFDTYYESGYYYCTLRNAVFDEPTYDA